MASLESFIHRRLVVLPQNARAEQAAHAMCNRNVGCVLVIDSANDLIGIVTDRDLACAFVESEEPTNKLKIAEIMTPDPVTASESDDLGKVIAKMEESGVRRIPILGSGKRARKCVGLVTLDDLIASRSIEPERITQIVKTQIARRGISHFEAMRTWRAEARSDAHREQTLNRFYHTVAKHTRLESSDLVARVTQHILTSMTRRLHFTGAAHLIAQLPENLHEDLLDLPAGPDRHITVNTLVKELSELCGCNKKTAKSVLENFCTALAEQVDLHEIEHAKSQLPDEFKDLFPPKKAHKADEAA